MTEDRKGWSAPFLRLLTQAEMDTGLKAVDRALMRHRASDLHLDREFDLATDAARQIEGAARRAAEQRLAEGAPAYLRIEGIDGIVRQLPDGTRDRVELVDGRIVVVGPLKPVSPSAVGPGI